MHLLSEENMKILTKICSPQNGAIVSGLISGMFVFKILFNSTKQQHRQVTLLAWPWTESITETQN